MPINDTNQSLYATSVRGERQLTILGVATPDKDEATKLFDEDKKDFAGLKLEFVEIKPGVSYEVASMATDSLH